MTPAFQSVEEIRARVRAQRPRPALLTGSSPAEPPEELSFAEKVGDVLVAPIRGAEAAVQDVWGLADAVAMDALPDYEERVFGESRTGLGGLVEGLTNFGVGFVGAGFVPLGWTAKLGRLAPAVRGAVKGAVADFAVFDGNEERLSNLLQSFPALQNPVSEFLAASEDDAEIEGRFKNAVEGLGIGAAVDLVALSLKGLRAGRAARAAGKDPAQVERAIDRAAPPGAMRAALKKMEAAHLQPGLKSEPGYAYHATNVERLDEIRQTGELRTHRPSDFTDQTTWPDGSAESRAYFAAKAENVWQFAPEEGTPVVLRRKTTGLAAESGTGDLISRKPIPATELEYLGADGAWHPLADASGQRPTSPVDPVQVLRTFDIDEAKANELLEEVRRREAPFSHATLTPRDPLDPRVNPRDLTDMQLLEQGMQRHDLNLSRYQGPDGALNLIRAMEQLVEPLKGQHDVARREFTANEEAAIKGLGDMVGKDLQGFIARGQADARSIADVMARVHTYRMAAQAQTHYAQQALVKASKSTDDRDILAAVLAVETAGELTSIVKSFGYTAGRGLRSFGRSVAMLPPGLLDRDAVEAALHERGGRRRALDIIAKAKALADSATDPTTRAARLGAFAEGGLMSRAGSVINEWWYNSLLGRPTTLVVNAMSNALVTLYKPLELIAGGAATFQNAQIQEGFREVSNLVHSAREAWSAVAAALRGDGHVLDPGALVSDIHDPAHKAITAARFGADPSTVHGQAIDWFGKIVRMPSAALTATDQFFQQLNYRTVARSQLQLEALRKGLHPDQVAAYTAAEMEKLMFRGQAYGSAQLYHRGVQEAVRSGLRSKAAVDEYAQEWVTKRLTDPDQAAEHARLSSLGAVAQQRAQEATFTAPLTPGTLPYRVQEAVLNHWYLRLVMPFVRTPINILGFAYQRSVGAATGVAQTALAKAFPKTAPALESSRNAFLRDMLGGDPRRKADAAGRLAIGMSTTAMILMKASEAGEDGLPLITGRGPADKERRQVLEAAGWQPYSIRIGDKYVSYNRLDPFASIMGVAADAVDYVKFAATEDQEAVEAISVGMAVALAHNLTNKTYLSGLASAIDMLQDPQRRFPSWYRTLGASFVPGQLAAAVSVEDPLLRDVQSLTAAAAARTPGLSDDLPPLRNVLGEPVRRAQALGSDVSSVANAFVPLLYREVKDDVIAKEMADLKHGFTPPRRVRGGLDLSSVKIPGGTNAYDRWLELHGTVEVGGKTLRQALRRLIQSRAYQRIPAESTPEVESPRIQMVQSVIDEYRQRALNQLIREVPALGDAEKARTQRRRDLLRGRDTRPQRATQQLQQVLAPR